MKWTTIVIILLLYGCAGKNAVIIKSDKILREVVRDTVFKTERDTIKVTYRVECPDGQKPTLTRPNKGGRAPTPNPSLDGGGKTHPVLNEPEVVLNGNDLSIECEARAQQLFLQWKEQHTSEIRQVPVEVRIEPSWWQKMLQFVGAVSLVTIGGYAAFGVVKSKINPFN